MVVLARGLRDDVDTVLDKTKQQMLEHQRVHGREGNTFWPLDLHVIEVH